MKVSIFAGLIAGAAATTVSIPMLKRQVANPSPQFTFVNDTLNQIGDLITALDTQVLAYTGGSDVSAITAAAQNIIDKAEGAVPTVQANPNVTADDEVLQLATTVGNPVEVNARVVVRDLEAKKDLIEANNLCETSYTLATGIYKATQDLGFTVANKIDNELYGPLAIPLINELLAIVNEAQIAFQPSNCTDAGTGGGPTTTTTTTTSETTTTTTTTTSSTVTTTITTTTSSMSYGVVTPTTKTTTTYGYSASSQPPKSSYSASSYSSSGYGASSYSSSGYSASSYSSSGYGASSYSSSGYSASSSVGGGVGGGSGGGASSSTKPAGSSATYPAGTVPYTGGAAAIAPAGALVMAIAALVV